MQYVFGMPWKLDQLATPLMEVLLQILQDIPGCLYISLFLRGVKDHMTYPLVMTNVAIENGHRNSGFSH